MLKLLKDEKLPAKILYPAKLPFRYEGEIKDFSNKQKLREFITTRCVIRNV